MPRPTKLHKRTKATSMQKPSAPNLVQTLENEEDPSEARRRFELELCWSIQQLEKELKSDIAKKDEKKAQDIWKALTMLKSNNHPMVRKRQLMRTYFGDYRSKMAKEEKKVNKMKNNIKIDSPAKAKGTFLRKSLFQQTGDDQFRFDFRLKPDDLVESCSTLKISDNPKEQEKQSTTDNKFKFTFSKTEFKFNFSNDNN